jgi:predicted PurR-regulated permease PerM
MTHLLLVGLVFGIGQSLEGTVITPKIVGDKLGLHPVVIILAILICSQILGFLGLLLAVPIASIVKVLIDEGIVKYKDTKLFKGS